MAGRGVGLSTRVPPPWPPRPSVSVIVCCYTRKRRDDLIAAIASLHGQTHQPEEVIVVVDHSRALERDLVRLKGVVVIPNRYRRGLSGARNSGLVAARGDVIAFLDDAAVAPPGRPARPHAPLWAPGVVRGGGREAPAWGRGRPGPVPPRVARGGGGPAGGALARAAGRPLEGRNPGSGRAAGGDSVGPGGPGGEGRGLARAVIPRRAAAGEDKVRRRAM